MAIKGDKYYIVFLKIEMNSPLYVILVSRLIQSY